MSHYSMQRTMWLGSVAPSMISTSKAVVAFTVVSNMSIRPPPGRWWGFAERLDGARPYRPGHHRSEPTPRVDAAWLFILP